MTNWIIKLTLISVMIFFHTGAWSADVSKQIKKGYQAGNVLGCITRLEIYAANAQNIIENPDPNFAKNSAETVLKVSIPYRDNVMQAAWDLYPLNSDWDAFYQQQFQQVVSNLDTRNVFIDTFTCVSDLMSIGVIYPKVDPKDMPPEQMEIMQRLFQQGIEKSNQKPEKVFVGVLDVDKAVRLMEAKYSKSSPPASKQQLKCAKEKWNSQVERGIFQEYMSAELKKIDFNFGLDNLTPLTYREMVVLLEDDENFKRLLNDTYKRYDWIKTDGNLLTEEYFQTEDNRLLQFFSDSLIHYCW